MSEIEENNWWHEGRRKILQSTIAYLVKSVKNSKILDVGCGTGGTSNAFLKFGYLVGTDLSIAALKLATKKGFTNILKSSLTNIPLKDETFDIITALDVIEHMENDHSVLLELNRLVKLNGYVIITVPAFQFLWSEHDVALSHFRRYTTSTLTKVLNETNFEVVRISYFISFIFLPYAVYRLLTKNSINQENPKTAKRQLPKIVNVLFERMMNVEDRLLKSVDLPFGVSLLCVAKKK